MLGNLLSQLLPCLSHFDETYFLCLIVGLLGDAQTLGRVLAVSLDQARHSELPNLKRVNASGPLAFQGWGVAGKAEL